MGLSKNNGDGFQTIILKLMSKENGQNIPAILKAMKKGDSGKYEEFDRFNKINGKIAKIELKTEAIPQGNGSTMDVDKVKIIFRDDSEKERYVLDLNYTNVTRNLFNSLLSIKDFSNVEFSFYQNKQGYNSVYVTENGEAVSWAYGLDVVPKPKKVIFQKKEVSDYTEVDDFFKEKLMEFIEAKKELLTEQSDSDVDVSSTDDSSETTNQVQKGVRTPKEQTPQEEPQMEVAGDVDDLPF